MSNVSDIITIKICKILAARDIASRAPSDSLFIEYFK